MKNRRTQSALLVAGAAAGAVAATWMGRRRLRAVSAPLGDLVESDRAELPIGSSADPDIDESLSRRHLPQDDTSGSALLGEVESRRELDAGDASLDDVWSSMPGLVGGEQTEGYDAVEPEDLGAVWLERATQTTHDERPHASGPNEVPNLEGLVMSEASRNSALAADDDELLDRDDDDDTIADDDLDAPDGLDEPIASERSEASKEPRQHSER